jgi:hypothetical protein
MEDYSKYQVPRYQTVYVASLYSKNKDEFFGSLELALEYMRNGIEEEFEEYLGGNIVFYSLSRSENAIGRIETKIVPHA